VGRKGGEWYFWEKRKVGRRKNRKKKTPTPRVRGKRANDAGSLLPKDEREGGITRTGLIKLVSYKSRTEEEGE